MINDICKLTTQAIKNTVKYEHELSRREVIVALRSLLQEIIDQNSMEHANYVIEHYKLSRFGFSEVTRRSDNVYEGLSLHS